MTIHVNKRHPIRQQKDAKTPKSSAKLTHPFQKRNNKQEEAHNSRFSAKKQLFTIVSYGFFPRLQYPDK
jgi:hypothetical protein